MTYSRNISTHYTATIVFNIPKNIPLLSVEENNDATDKTPFSWWVKRATLYYYDDDGDVNEIEACDEDHDASKWPDNFEEIINDDEEEETTQHKCVDCDEYKSCGNFDNDKDYHCEECANHHECQDCNVKNGNVEYNMDKCKYICLDCIGYNNDSEDE